MSRMNTFRLTEFMGLNKAINPHNVDDKEFTDMTNLLLTKNEGLISRKGYTKVGSVGTGPPGVNYLRAVWTAAWTSEEDTLYYATPTTFGKMVGSTATDIETLTGSRRITPIRYKDDMLLLTEGDYLKRYGADEAIKAVSRPQFVYKHIGTITAIADHDGLVGVLEDDRTYQYSVSFTLGANGVDGESPNAIYETAYMSIYGIRGGVYANATTDSVASKNIIKCVNEWYYCHAMHGYGINSVKLYRRKVVKPVTEVETDMKVMYTNWELIDEATVTLDSDDAYTMDMSLGVISAVNGVHSSSSSPDEDWAYFSLYFEDIGLDPIEAGVPYEMIEVVVPKAKYLARLHQRIFLANIIDPTYPSASKTVRYSYRGWNPIIDKAEISDYIYDAPMLIFPMSNHFEVDAEDIEDEITAIHAYQNNIMIFTQRCMFLWREGMTEPVKLADNIGCIRDDTVQEFEGKLVWLSHNGVYEYNGSSVKNITQEKVESIFDDITMANYATACIFDRKYFLAADFNPNANNLNNAVLVYDFDLKKWHKREYTAADGSTLYIDYFYVDYDGADETMYVACKNSSAECLIAQFEDGYKDEDQKITCPFKTKYYGFGAPDVAKSLRVSYLDVENFSGSVSTKIYIDSLNEEKRSFTHSGISGGFIVNSATHGVVNRDKIKNFSDELFTFSLPRGLLGSRIMFEFSLDAYINPLKIHMIGFEWLPKRKLKRKYGG